MNFRLLLWSGALALVASGCTSSGSDEWTELFNGKDLTGWKASEPDHEGTFRVENGMIVANGERSHLFYTGHVAGGNFKNFELKAELMVLKGSNSGIYIHSKYQEEGWPSQGFEIQVDNSHIGLGDYREFKKTGSLYGVRNVFKAFAGDSVWFTMHIIVRANHVTVDVNGIKTVDFIEPADSAWHYHGRLSSGTFALQGHDPNSKVYFRSLKVRLLPDDIEDTTENIIFNDKHQHMMALQAEQFAFTDFNIDANQNLNTDEALNFFYRTGINLGLVLDPSNSNLSSQLAQYKEYPVFIGLRMNEGANSPALDGEAKSHIDYTIGAVSTDGDTSKPEAYMNDYVKRIVSFLGSKSVTIWAKPTQLPPALADDYQKLWTNDRMDKVIDAAIQNGVAIEIDNQTQLPGMTFIKRAKKKGCFFTYSGVYAGDPMGNLDYIFTVIAQDSLTYKDNYMPGAPWPQY